MEDLYTGCTRKMKIQRNIRDTSGATMRISEVLIVLVKPGWKSGTKLTFADKGETSSHHAEDGLPSRPMECDAVIAI